MAKYTCEQPGYEANFIEFDDKWSRRDVREFWDKSGDEWLEIVRRHIVSLSLSLSDGALVDPAEVTEQGLDDVDYVVFMWFKSVPGVHVQELGSLGEALRRRLFASTETKEAEVTAE